MDVRHKLRDALDFLEPHFGTGSVLLEEFLADDPTIADYDGPADECSILRYAGEMAGHYYYTLCNNEKVKDDAMLSLFQNTASEYAGNCYHAARCSASHYMMRTRKTDQMLDRFIDSALHPERLRPDQKFILAIQPLELAEPLGYILYRRYSASKLGEFARMGLNDALKFLADSAREVLPDSKRF
jgi:hypothetical protein